MLKICAVCETCNTEAIALQPQSITQARWWFENYGWYIEPDGHSYCPQCENNQPRWGTQPQK